MKKILKGCCLLLVFGLLNACLSPDDIKLDDREKNKMIQQLFTEKATEIQPKIDKSCSHNYNRMVSKATDSLVNVYLDSINLNK